MIFFSSSKRIRATKIHIYSDILKHFKAWNDVHTPPFWLHSILLLFLFIVCWEDLDGFGVVVAVGIIVWYSFLLLKLTREIDNYALGRPKKMDLYCTILLLSCHSQCFVGFVLFRFVLFHFFIISCCSFFMQCRKVQHRYCLDAIIRSFSIFTIVWNRWAVTVFATDNLLQICSTLS